MVPKVFQPVVVILIIGALITLRLLPTIDPLQNLIGGQTASNDQIFNTDNAQIEQLLSVNERLRSELEFNNPGQNLIRADVLGKTVASFREAVRVSAGSKHGVAVDQPVLSRGFLVGRIGSSENELSTVLLLGDPDVRIPVVIGQAQGIVVPRAGGLIIDQVVGEAEAGANVLSSGVDGVYPPGLLVGTVGDQLERDIFDRFILNTPLDIQRLDFVSIMIGPK